MPLIIIVAGLLFSQRYAIFDWLTGSHMVSGSPGIGNLRLPPGFQVNVFYRGLNSPRFITFGPDDTLFVAESGTGSIVALSDPNHTGKATEKKVVINGLNDPTSLVFYQGVLYVGEQSQISRFTFAPGLQVTS